ncbi:MAG: hypothetical protein ACK4Z5_05460 [Brevundimonas sp.]
MRALQVILALAVLAYAGWLAWPFASPFLEGASPDIAAMRAEAALPALPVAAFWIGAIVLYVIAALMLGAGNPRAAIAYFIGFLADAALRLAIDRSGGSAAPEIAARSTELAPYAEPMSQSGVDPVWIVLGALFLLGLVIAAVSRRRRRRRIPGQLAA